MSETDGFNAADFAFDPAPEPELGPSLLPRGKSGSRAGRCTTRQWRVWYLTSSLKLMYKTRATCVLVRGHPGPHVIGWLRQ